MWQEKNSALQASFRFQDFKEAFAFMTEIALHVESLNHHPQWTNTWNQVDIRLTTHDAGNTVTAKDRNLAEIISGIYARFRSD